MLIDVSRSLILTMILVALATPDAGAEPSHTDSETKTGFLIPSQCQPREGAKRPDGPYDEWPAPHTTECSLRPACIESGFGLWVVDRFYRFDESDQEKALHYFRTTKRTSYNKVRVTGDFTDAEAVRVFDMVLTD